MGHYDVTQGTGNGGVMLIRVADSAGTPGVISGNEVQFHIRAGLSATYVGSPGFRWAGYSDGAWRHEGRVANIQGTAWRHLASFHVGSTQDVCFHIDASGTQGFGGPTDFWHRVNRTPPPPPPPAARPPEAPRNLRVAAVTPTSFGVWYDRGPTNGAAITADIAEWSLDASFTQIVWQDGTGAPGNGPNGYTNPRGNGDGPGPLLIPGREYFVRIKSDSYGYGWSGWSPTFSARTYPSIRARVAGIFRHGIPWIKVAGAWRRGIRVWRKQSDVWVQTR